MTKKSEIVALKARSVESIRKLFEQYECGPIQSPVPPNALYDRHLLFDDVVEPTAASPRFVK